MIWLWVSGHGNNSKKQTNGTTSTKTFHTSKDTTLNRQPIEWEKTFMSHIHNEGPVYRIYIEYTMFKSENKKQIEKLLTCTSKSVKSRGQCDKSNRPDTTHIPHISDSS